MRDWYKDWEDRSGQNDYDEEDGKFTTTPAQEVQTQEGGAGVDYEPVPPPEDYYGNYEESFVISDADAAAIEAEAELKSEKAYVPAQPKKVEYKQLSIFELLEKTEDEAQ